MAGIHFGIERRIGSVPPGFLYDVGTQKAVYSCTKTNLGKATMKSTQGGKQA